MSFDYLEDLFGRSRKRKTTRFSDLECRAIALLKGVKKGKVSYDDFFTDFSQMIKEFDELCGSVIDQDTPLWFNSFAANVFLRWRDWHILRTTHRLHPEKFDDPQTQSGYLRIAAMNYDEWLQDKIRYCLKNL